MKKFITALLAGVLALTFTGCDVETDIDPDTGAALEKLVDYLEGHYGCQFPDENASTPEPPAPIYETSIIMVTKDPCLKNLKIGIIRDESEIVDMIDANFTEDNGTYVLQYDFNITHDDLQTNYAYGFQFDVPTRDECPGGDK